jgi:hypothetical protein
VERLGDTFAGADSEALFREQFLEVKKIVANAAPHAVPDWPFRPEPYARESSQLHRPTLFREQQDILRVLATAGSAEEAKAKLSHHPLLSGSSWIPDQWELAMLEAAIQIGRKWGIDQDELS